MAKSRIDGTVFNSYKNSDEYDRLIDLNWDIEYFKKEIDYLEKNLKEYVEDRKKIIKALKTLANKIYSTKFTKLVYLEKSRNYYKNLMSYYVGVYNIPQISNGLSKAVVLEPKLFEGGYNLKAAIEYAANLKIKYNCAISLKNWDKQTERILKKINKVLKLDVIEI